MTSPDDRLTITDVAALARIKPATFRAYLVPRAARGGKTHAPAPDGHLGRTPWWRRDTIETWLEERGK